MESNLCDGIEFPRSVETTFVKISMPYFMMITISLQISIFQCKDLMLCHLECKVVKPEKAENLKAKIYAMAMRILEVLRPNKSISSLPYS